MAVTKQGHTAIAATTGNEDCHLILRGGKTPNYDAASVEAACTAIAKGGQIPRVMIDASHANSDKQPENQPRVIDDIAAQLAAGEQRIVGVMVESHLVGGRQDLLEDQPLRYGQSITDGCIDWDTSLQVLDRLADAVRARRAARTAAQRTVRTGCLG
jgi:3-deoxy-7-phosphoheptulonate synthase